MSSPPPLRLGRKFAKALCFSALSALSLLAACGGGGGGGSGSGSGSGSFTPVPTQTNTPIPTSNLTAKEQILALEASGAIPKLDRSNIIAGTDANNNGVRDDVETYISSGYTQAQQRAAALQFAKAMQAAVLVGGTDIDAGKRVTLQLLRGVNCVYAKFTGSNPQAAVVISELEAISTNTKQRLLAYLAYNKAMDGTSWAMPDGDSCE